MFTSKDYTQQLHSKVKKLHKLLEPFNLPQIEVFESPLINFRQRAEFRLWRNGSKIDYAMFKPGSQQPILVEQLPIASCVINQLMRQLKPLLESTTVLANKVFQVEFLSTFAGDSLITLCYHQRLNDNWLLAAKRLAASLNCQIIGRSRGQRLVVERDYVIEKLCITGRNFTFQQPEGSFSQPNAAVNQQMLTWASQQIADNSADLLEMYCGNGNFTIPLATRVKKIFATEISQTSIKALINNLRLNDIANVQQARLSAEELTQALRQERNFFRLKNINLNDYNFEYVLVDPPRAGVDSQTCQLLSNFKHIIYISCNPTTLAENLQALTASHTLSAVALFDQFPYTEHIETGILLSKSK